jgi:Nif-specific regulatory protein
MDQGDVRKLSTLLEVSQQLGSTLDLRTALVRVLEVLEEGHGTLAGAVTLFDRDSGELEIEAATGMTWRVRRRASYKLGEGVTGRVVQSGKPVVVPRVSHEPLFLDRTGVWKASGRDELSFVCVPVVVDGRTEGSLGVTFPYEANRAFDREAEFLGVVASMIGQSVRVHRLVETERRRLLDENSQLRQELKERYEFRNIIGSSREMRQVYEEVAQVAGSPTTVMIRGESGTGKEMIAHAIHYNSPRSEQPFVKVNCGALPESLIESELFGYEPGAFTDARAQKKGRFELADGGTLFLDEVGELSHSTQVKLLRVLQEKEFERLGRCDLDQGRCACDRGDQSRPRGSHGRRGLPGGSLLPAERVQHLRARASGPEAGRPAARGSFHREVRDEAREARAPNLDAGDRHAHEPPLAGERT